MQDQYNLKFHEALKLAVEDGCEIEDSSSFKYILNEDGYLCYRLNNEGLCFPSISTLMKRSWRTIEKPKKFEFECPIGRGVLSDGSGIFPTFDYNCKIEDEIQKFIGKKVKVTIEEIL